MPDYENDLAFKPAMTTKELCKYIREKYSDNPKMIVDTEVKGCESIIINNGEGDEIEFDVPTGMVILNGVIIAYPVTEERMKNIIDNLYGED